MSLASQLCAEECLGQLLWRELVLSCCGSLATSQLGALRNIVCESLLAPGGKRVSDSVYFSSWNRMGRR